MDRAEYYLEAENRGGWRGALDRPADGRRARSSQNGALTLAGSTGAVADSAAQPSSAAAQRTPADMLDFLPRAPAAMTSTGMIVSPVSFLSLKPAFPLTDH